MKKQILVPLLIFLMSMNIFGQKTDRLAKEPPYPKYKISKKSLTDDDKGYTLQQEDSPIKLDKIEIISNSMGTLSTPQFIYKGEVDDESAPLLVDPSGFTALINGAEFSSISPDDGGQFYVSQATEIYLFGMIRRIHNVRNTIIELRFGADDAGLAIDYWGSEYIYKVPFTAWDINGTPTIMDDDIQLIPLTFSLTSDSLWGIHSGHTADWTLNPAQEADWIYLHYPLTSYADFADAYNSQITSGEFDPLAFEKHCATQILRRITINSLDENPLQTINAINGFTRPKAGTTIRWTFQITPYAPRAYDNPVMYAVVGEEAIFYIQINGYPHPAFSIISAPAGMTVDNESWNIRWTPSTGEDGYQSFTLEATNDHGSLQQTTSIWVDAYPWDFKDHDNNNAWCSVYNNGSFGSVPRYAPGAAFTYKGNNALYLGQLYIAQSDSQVSGKYGADRIENEYGTMSLVQSVNSQIAGFDQAFRSEYNDERADHPVGVRVTQNSYSKSTAPDDDYIILDYEIQNTQSEMLNGIYVALFMDWDVGEYYDNNLGGYDATRQLSYIYEAGGNTNPYFYGSALLKGEVSGHTLEARNDDNDVLLYQQMQEMATVSADTGDFRAFLATGPYTISPGQTIRVVYAVLGGDDLADLQANADAAHAVNLNRPPVVETAIANQTLAVGGYNLTLDLNTEPVVFSDPDKDVISYSAESSNSLAATVNVSGSVLTVTPVGQGNCTITVTADDGHEGVNTTTFDVSVIPGPSIATGNVTDLTPVSAVLNGSVNPNGRTTSVFFEYGQSTSYGDTIWADQDPVSGTNIQTVTASVYDLTIGTTYHFRLVAQNELIEVLGSNQQFTTESYPSNITVNNTISFPTRANPEDYPVTDYRIVGIPGKATDITIANLLSGEQDRDWQVYWDNGGNSDYFVKYDGGSEFKLETGRAFWLIHNGPWGVDISVLSAPLVNNDYVEIDLHNGWNLITNPYDQPVSWSAIQQENSVTRPIISYAGTSSWQQPSTLDQYTGYYFFNASNLSTLKIPYKAIFLKPAQKENISWQVQIEMITDLITDELTYFGTSEKAEEDFDDLDFRKPRAMGPIPTVYFPHPDWDAQYSAFARDIRPPVEDIEIWEFDVYSANIKKVKLTFTAVDQVPEKYDIFFLDLQHLDYSDLRKKESYIYKAVKEISKFQVIVGSEEAVREEINKFVPTDFALGHNYPNPFNPITTIPIAIPSKARTILKVYNILGQEINTLFDGTLDVGRHYFTWDGRNYSGSKLPSGVYIYRLITESGISFAKKMVYIK